ncbi:MAG: SHOCT domain-containing protein [Anaerolineae bacterium]|jgi:putative membrane protein
MMGMGFGLGGWGLLLMVFLWGGLIALAVGVVWALFPRSGGRAQTDHVPGAGEILDRRYARGEINREQYDLMKETLSDAR